MYADQNQPFPLAIKMDLTLQNNMKVLRVYDHYVFRIFAFLINASFQIRTTGQPIKVKFSAD